MDSEDPEAPLDEHSSVMEDGRTNLDKTIDRIGMGELRALLCPSSAHVRVKAVTNGSYFHCAASVSLVVRQQAGESKD